MSPVRSVTYVSGLHTEWTPGHLDRQPGFGRSDRLYLFPRDKLLRHAPGGWHDSIAGCPAIFNPIKRIYGPTLLDTGAIGISISSANAADLSGLPGFGTEIAFKNESGVELRLARLIIQ